MVNSPFKNLRWDTGKRRNLSAMWAAFVDCVCLSAPLLLFVLQQRCPAGADFIRLTASSSVHLPPLPPSGPAWLHCYHCCPNTASPGGWVFGRPGGGFGSGSWGDKDCAADCGFMMPSGTSVAIRLYLTAARMAPRLSLRNPVMVWVGITLTAGLCKTGRGFRSMSTNSEGARSVQKYLKLFIQILIFGHWN